VSWLHGTVARLRLLFGRPSNESRSEREFQFHIDMEVERLVREQGLEPGEARRQALAAFGGVEQHREALRDGRGTAWLGGLSLDFKLGLRMLAKTPGLTLVGVLGMSVAVTIGALAFAAVNTVTSKALPVDEGDRVVRIQNIDVRESDPRPGTHLHDLAVWREILLAVEDLSAYRIVNRNLVVGEFAPVAMGVAEMSASGFRLTRVAPFLGRHLTTDDETPGAPNVVVVGHDLWVNRFGGRRDVVGTTVQLGAGRHTVVGVMPQGFAFPVNNQLWTPLRLDPLAYQRGEAPYIDVFGRLAPGASLADARLQLTTIGQRLSTSYPQSHENIRPRILHYAGAFLENPQMAWMLHLGQLLVSLLLVVIGTNVAVLVYARTASRAGEIAVRSALGASRRRVVMQLFAEALVLSGVASLVGIVVARFVFRQVDAMVRQSADNQVPYWMRLEITPAVVLYAAGLAVLAAVIIGLIPGLKATRYHVAANLKEHSGNASMRLGRTWTALLVTQVAVSVAALPFAASGIQTWLHLVRLDRDTPAIETFVIATPQLDTEDRGLRKPAEVDIAHRARYTARVAELARRLEAEAGGFDVVLMSAPPGVESYLEVDIAQEPTASPSDTTITRANGALVYHRVDSSFMASFDVRRLSGRGFTADDFVPGTRTAVVNRSFVAHFLGGGNALGRRVRPSAQQPDQRTAAAAGPALWWEIVGVVDDFPGLLAPNALRPKLYLPLHPAETYPLTMAVRGASVAATADRIREIAMEVEPGLSFTSIRRLADILEDAVKVQRLALLGLVMVTLSVVLLSAAGIYALMSFTIARRRREIGIRSALGARPVRVLAGVLSSAMRQIGIGIVIGVAGTGALFRLAGQTSSIAQLLVILLLMAGMMVVVGGIATIGPARRALRVQPAEVLKAE
jgi:predicted permease